MTGFEHQTNASRTMTALVIAADADAARPAREVLEATGARILDVLAPTETTAFGDVAPDLVMLEAEALDDDTLDALLPAVEALSHRGVQVIAAIGSAQVDPVARYLLDGDVQLLCSADAAQRMAAVLVARAAAPPGVREPGPEAERLRRLSDEIARIAETLARLAGSGSAPENVVSDRRPGYRAAEVAPGATVEAGDIRDAIRSRRMRDQHFAAGLFEDPAWDMLLDLFAAYLEGARVSVSSLCIAAAVAPTTALRWIGRMTGMGLLERRPDPDDRRRAFVELSDDARVAMRDYCTAAKRQGLPIA
jgi:hypothetical protein